MYGPKPARKEIIDSVQTGNKKLNIIDNLDYIKSKIKEIEEYGFL